MMVDLMVLRDGAAGSFGVLPAGNVRLRRLLMPHAGNNAVDPHYPVDPVPNRGGTLKGLSQRPDLGG